MITFPKHLAVIVIAVFVMAAAGDCGSWFVEWHDGPGPGGDPAPFFPQPMDTLTPAPAFTPTSTTTPTVTPTPVQESD